MTPPLPPISRRALLRGAGAAIALPWLEAMEPLARATTDCRRPPVRFACLFMPNGVWAPDWRPTHEGSDFELSKTLTPFAPLRDRLLVLSNLRNRNAQEGEGHYVKTTSLLSGAKVRRTGGRDVRCGTTVDQYAAQRVGMDCPLASLELGMDPVSPKVDMGYSTVYGGHISWRSPEEPAPKEIHPQRAFERLFRGGRRAADPDRDSVLDLVLGEASALRAKVGARDRAKLEEYLSSLRELEQRMVRVRALAQDGAGAHATEPPRELAAEDFQARIGVMLELIALAFVTGATRFATFMFGNSVSGRNFSFLDGVQGGHHDLSHHENQEDKIRQYQLIQEWHAARVAELALRLDAHQDGEDGSTVLDNSVLMFASGIRDGNQHEPFDLPIAMLGGWGGRVATGRHLAFPKDSPLCGVYLSLLEVLGCPAARFGDADRPLLTVGA